MNSFYLGPHPQIRGAGLKSDRVQSCRLCRYNPHIAGCEPDPPTFRSIYSLPLMPDILSIPETLRAILARTLAASGDDTPIVDTQPVGGGCISTTLRIITAKDTYFLKWNGDSPPGMFRSESEGLSAIRSTSSIRVPEVFGFMDRTDSEPGFILMEWIECPAAGVPVRKAGSRLGAQLAALHRGDARGDQVLYGWDEDNYLGVTVQSGCWSEDWVCFFRDRRLQPQVRIAVDRARIGRGLHARLETLLSRVGDWLGGVPRQSSLLHGDLWRGNVLWGSQLEPVLIDPAVYYGDREAEIAYTELFGGFPTDFYRAYESEFPCPPGREERRDLYNLYHLLNHLNTFGGSYLSAVEAVVRKYVGL